MSLIYKQQTQGKHVNFDENTQGKMSENHQKLRENSGKMILKIPYEPCTDDHLFRLSQSVVESFNRRKHVVAAFLYVEKAFDNVWHNGLRYEIFMLDLPTKMTRWLSDFLVGRVIQVNVNGLLSDKISPIAGVRQGYIMSPLLFLMYVNNLPNPHHRQRLKSQFADDTALWAASKNLQFQQNFCVGTYEKWQSGVPNGE